MRVLILGLLFLSTASHAQLSGRVTSAEEGAMEGVLVSAKKPGSTITVTVVSDREGRYRFPEKKARSRQIHAQRARGRLRDRRPKHGRGVPEGDGVRHRVAQDPGSRGAALQRRMDGEHARHRSAEGAAPQLRRLPHDRSALRARASTPTRSPRPCCRACRPTSTRASRSTRSCGRPSA